MKRFYLVDDDFLDAVDDLADKVGDRERSGYCDRSIPHPENQIRRNRL